MANSCKIFGLCGLLFTCCLGLSSIASANTIGSLGIAAHVLLGQCGCLCVEGAPRTLCSTVAEARRNPSLCRTQTCPDFVATEQQGRRYVAPNVFADNCREVRVWSPDSGAYTGVKVCDVLDIEEPSQ